MNTIETSTHVFTDGRWEFCGEVDGWMDCLEEGFRGVGAHCSWNTFMTPSPSWCQRKAGHNQAGSNYCCLDGDHGGAADDDVHDGPGGDDVDGVPCGSCCQLDSWRSSGLQVSN